MAIMTKCCCCGIRMGSLAIGIYNAVGALLSMAYGAFRLIRLPEFKDDLYTLEELENDGYTNDINVFGDMNIDGYITAMKVALVYSFLYNGLRLVTGLILILGIKRDKKEWLIPFMAAKSFGFTEVILAVILISYTVSKMGMLFGGIGAVVILVVFIVSLTIDIACILCVLSQYQEYRDGRGRLTDELSLIQHQTESGGKQPAGTGGFSYQNMTEDGPDTPPPYNAQVP